MCNAGNASSNSVTADNPRVTKKNFYIFLWEFTTMTFPRSAGGRCSEGSLAPKGSVKWSDTMVITKMSSVVTGEGKS